MAVVCIQVLVRKIERKRPLGRFRRRWEDITGLYLREIGWGVWIGFIGFRAKTIDELL
jgi:hypothetical protein